MWALGDPGALAAGAAHEYQRRTFSGRHPILMFLVAPLPMALVAWAAVVVAVTSLFAWLGPESGATVPAAWRYGMPVILVLWVIVPPTLVALWICRMSIRSGRTWRWIAVSRNRSRPGGEKLVFAQRAKWATPGPCRSTRSRKN